MKRKATQTRGSGSQILNYLVRDGKKTGIAIALVTVMAIMWLRVFTGQKPKSADARPKTEQTETDASTKTTRVHFVELPVEAGRNDRIHRDFFTAQDWGRFSIASKSQGTDSDTEVQTVASNRKEEVITRLAKTLRLEAVVLLSENPQAVINERTVGIGGTFALKDGADVYAFEVVQIEEDTVIVKCEDRQFPLKLSHPTDVKN
jgi:hypothetical protein